ncbi:MAG: hypothetical protein FGM29_08655 [Actinobacteria bacterium]|nr:hypothetical protein [Actinomycetota bacterium]
MGDVVDERTLVVHPLVLKVDGGGGRISTPVIESPTRPQIVTDGGDTDDRNPVVDRIDHRPA